MDQKKREPAAVQADRLTNSKAVAADCNRKDRQDRKRFQEQTVNLGADFAKNLTRAMFNAAPRAGRR